MCEGEDGLQWLRQIHTRVTLELLLSHREKEYSKLTHLPGKLVGEKRKRSSYTVSQSVFLQQELGKGNLDTKEGRQVVSDIFTKETGEKFDVERLLNQNLTSSPQE